MEVEDWNFKVNRCSGNLHTDTKYGFDKGNVNTPYGTVSCYAQGDEKYRKFTSLSFIHNGIEYCRNFNGKRYSKRGIVTKARQFAEEIYNGFYQWQPSGEKDKAFKDMITYGTGATIDGKHIPYHNRLADITAYTNEIIEMCAKECNKIAWSNKNTPMLGPELNALKCEEAIRNLKG